MKVAHGKVEEVPIITIDRGEIKKGNIIMRESEFRLRYV